MSVYYGENGFFQNDGSESSGILNRVEDEDSVVAEDILFWTASLTIRTALKSQGASP